MMSHNYQGKAEVFMLTSPQVFKSSKTPQVSNYKMLSKMLKSMAAVL